MEYCNRTQSTDRLWPYLIAAAVGTFLLAFVPSDAWRAGESLSVILAKQLLTVLLLCVVPAVWARLAFRISPWILLGSVVFAYGCGLVVTGDPKDALYTTLLCALPGAGLWGLQRLKLSNFRTVIYGSFLVLAALFGFVCLRDLIRAGDAYASYKHLVTLYETVIGRLMNQGNTPEGIRLAEESAALIDLFRSNAESFCVSILLLPSMAAALSNVLLSHLFNRNGGAELVKLPRFSEWRCERWYVVFSGVFLIATFLLGMAGWHTADALSGIASVLWRMPCMLGGLCTVRRLGLRLGRKWIFWAAIVLLIVLPPAAVMLLTFRGLMSALRKPMNVGEDGERK